VTGLETLSLLRAVAPVNVRFVSSLNSSAFRSSLTMNISVVDQNPGAFSEAYWEINSLRVYTPFWTLSCTIIWLSLAFSFGFILDDTDNINGQYFANQTCLLSVRITRVTTRVHMYINGNRTVVTLSNMERSDSSRTYRFMTSASSSVYLRRDAVNSFLKPPDGSFSLAIDCFHRSAMHWDRGS